MNSVSFKQGLQAEWQALVDAGTVDQNTLYFCIDTKRIYKGSLLFGSGRIENLQQRDDIEIYGGSASDVVEVE